MGFFRFSIPIKYSVYGNARIHGNAQVADNARVYGGALLLGDALVSRPYHCASISNQKFGLTFTPQNVVGGCRLFSHKQFRDLTLDQCESEWEEWELENYKGYQRLFLERLKKL